MINYEALSPLKLNKDDTVIKAHPLPELVHFDDSALAVLLDFYQASLATIKDTATMEDAIHDMELHEVQLLLVVDSEHQLIGLLSAEDVLGEKPIQYIQQNRLSRHHILVHTLMTPLAEIPALTIEAVKKARIGHIVKTLHALNAPTALVVHEENDKKIVLGAFTTAQISKQLHQDVRK